MRTRIYAYGLLFALTLLASCVTAEMSEWRTRRAAEPFNQKIRESAFELMGGLRDFEPWERTVAVTTFVHLDTMDETSSFGRYVSERMGMELHKLGFKSVELRQRKEIEIINDKGEFMLSRRSAELLKKSKVDAALVGSYSIVGDEIVVNAKLVSVNSANVLSVSQIVAATANVAVDSLLNRKKDEPPAPKPVVRAKAMN